ncbi:thiamine phosphate synthase [uncultured Ilyobacter sp.]|uniref:thiamine phosphate synthase n=1 Tax=uncultured Ilyobacter sp. TaxID=544433 RepID=UPI0029C0C8A9|nr:thiamine phosphate synthase [uncultured Ilyobacter sp.]
MRSRITIPTGLYGITGEAFSNGKSNLQCVESMIKAGIKIIQYREKDKPLRDKINDIKKIRELCRENEVLFIINDHVDMAILVDADGVHIGQEDMHPSDVRQLIGPDKIIGLSTHSQEEGLASLEEDIDYIGVGPIFPTTTKDRKAVGLDYLDFAVKNLDIPFVAIGGIKEHNIEKIVKAGADRICLVSEVIGAQDIAKKVQRLNEIVEKKD